MTVLAEKKGGVFPFNSVYEVVDGRHVVIAHDIRDMPIWGDRFTRGPNQAAGRASQIRKVGESAWPHRAT